MRKRSLGLALYIFALVLILIKPVLNITGFMILDIQRISDSSFYLIGLVILIASFMLVYKDRKESEEVEEN